MPLVLKPTTRHTSRPKCHTIQNLSVTKINKNSFYDFFPVWHELCTITGELNKNQPL